MSKLNRIVPVKGFSLPDLGEVWRARELVWTLLLRQYRTKYKQTFLGGLWAIVPHLVKVVVYTVVFGELIAVPSEGFPYPVFVFSGLLAWSLFSGALSSSGQSLHAFKAMIAKVYFPRLVIPIVSSLFGLVDFLLAFIVLLILMFAFGVAPGPYVWVFPAFVILALAMGFAIGLWINGFIGKYRDFRMGLGYGLSLWLYCTPVIYPMSIVPPEWQTLYALNPAVGIVQGFRWTMLGGDTVPSLMSLVASLVFTAVCLTTGLAFFNRAQANYIDRM